MAVFTDRLKEVKKRHCLTQAQLAVAAKVSLRTYQRYEYGEREPSLSVLIALADYFQVSIDYLAGCTDNPARNH